MSKKVWSGRDSEGRLYVDCAECTRGGNGTDKDKCCSGWRYKKGGKGGCFIGKLIEGITA